jgi:GNAT superfamily N-acetyltransferase
MLYELAPQDFGVTRPLFDQGPPTYTRVVAAAARAGNMPGRCWVDDPAAPRTALLWDTHHCCDLAGAADNAAVNAALAGLLAATVLPGAGGLCKIRVTDPAWEDVLPALVAPAAVQRRERAFYTFAAPRILDWAARVPPGARVVPIDAALLARADLAGLDAVREEIAECWTSEAAFLRAGLGVAWLADGALVGWCTGEYASGDVIGIGIATDPAYRGRGVATGLAAAFVAACRAQGRMPLWDAWADNGPSCAVAAKVGFRLTTTYPAYLVVPPGGG